MLQPTHPARQVPKALSLRTTSPLSSHRRHLLLVALQQVRVEVRVNMTGAKLRVEEGSTRGVVPGRACGYTRIPVPS